MTNLKHQPCKTEYPYWFSRRKTEKEEHNGHEIMVCYGIVDMATDDVLPECRMCDEWEFNVIDLIME